MAKKKENKGGLLIIGTALGIGLITLLSASGKKENGGIDDDGEPAPGPGGGSDLPRGIRNNNPGNIIMTDIAWEGKIPNAQNTDGMYEQFTSYPYGVRALIKNLQSYIHTHGLTTIRGIISRWAPDASLSNYISFVSDRTGIDPDMPYPHDNIDKFYDLIAAIGYFENGREAISRQQFNEGMQLL